MTSTQRPLQPTHRPSQPTFARLAWPWLLLIVLEVVSRWPGSQSAWSWSLACSILLAAGGILSAFAFSNRNPERSINAHWAGKAAMIVLALAGVTLGAEIVGFVRAHWP